MFVVYPEYESAFSEFLCKIFTCLTILSLPLTVMPKSLISNMIFIYFNSMHDVNSCLYLLSSYQIQGTCNSDTFPPIFVHVSCFVRLSHCHYVHSLAYQQHIIVTVVSSLQLSIVYRNSGLFIHITIISLGRDWYYSIFIIILLSFFKYACL